MPVVRTDGRAGWGRCTVTWLPNFLGWVDLLTHGAPQARFARQSSAKTYLGNMKAAKTIAMFIGVFFFCWLPYSTYIIVISLCSSCWSLFPGREDEVFSFLLMCGYLTSALNPFVFALRNGSLKNTYSKLLSSALSKSLLNDKRDRRLSSLSELTFASEIPDLSDRDVQLQRIRPSETELQITEIILQNTSD